MLYSEVYFTPPPTAGVTPSAISTVPVTAATRPMTRFFSTLSPSAFRVPEAAAAVTRSGWVTVREKLPAGTS